ncbi:MAG TPA: cytochrome P450 [Acidimicrobiales bacterium]|nr:cytochrome P450 [Acidimicrobiales bacterium]
MLAEEESSDASPAMVVDLAASDDPRAISRELRQQPVMRIEDMFTLVTRREHVEDALRKTATFCWSQVPMDLGNVRPLIPLMVDPPQHVKYRRILDPLFSPKKMALLEDEIVGLVKDLVDVFAARGSCDLHEEFAVPLPCRVFLRLMGLPYADLDHFLAVKDDIIRPDGMTMEDQAPARQAAGKAVYTYFEAELRRRHAAPPADDLLAQIMAGEVDGVRLTDEEVMDICYLFIIAGLDTVTDSLDCFFAYLAQEPDQRRLLVEDESVIPSAVEELLRWESPVPAVPRVATEDVEFGGCPVKAGEQVMLLLGSANTDDAAHPGADTVDLQRNPNPHLAFGGGVHRCLGSHLARVELRVALREFHRRIPDYWLAPGTVLQYTPGLRSLTTLPLEFPPAG